MCALATWCRSSPHPPRRQGAWRWFVVSWTTHALPLTAHKSRITTAYHAWQVLQESFAESNLPKHERQHRVLLISHVSLRVIYAAEWLHVKRWCEFVDMGPRWPSRETWAHRPLPSKATWFRILTMQRIERTWLAIRRIRGDWGYQTALPQPGSSIEPNSISLQASLRPSRGRYDRCSPDLVV